MALSQAIVRGTFSAECARIERTGIPVDRTSFERVKNGWNSFRKRLIAEVDASYGVFVDGGFSAALFDEYLKREAIEWPRLPSGALALDDETFRQKSRVEPRIAPLRELRVSLAQMRSNKIRVDADGRTRTHLRPFASKTGRSQPSTSANLFGTSRWMRSFIQAPPGHSFAYLDYRSQEIAIAAYLSGDEALLAAYLSGDPYCDFAKRAGLMPKNGTKQSHPRERAICKTIVLGVQYGMGAESMAQRSGLCLDQARELLQRHREAYPKFWSYVEAMRDRIALSLPAYTPVGWRFQAGAGATINHRSSMNWPIQSTGADIMRVAVLRCTRAGVPPCTTIHDALAFVVPTAEADALLGLARAEMVGAAIDVVGGEIGVDLTRYDHPDVYKDEDGFIFYEKVMRLAEADS